MIIVFWHANSYIHTLQNHHTDFLWLDHDDLESRFYKFLKYNLAISFLEVLMAQIKCLFDKLI